MIDYLFNFLDSVLIKNLRLFNLNFLMDYSFNNLNNWLFYNFPFNSNNLLNQRHLNYFFNDFILNNFFDNRNFYNFFYFLDPVNIHRLFNHNFNGFFNLDNISHNDNLLDCLWHFDYSLDYFLNRNNFFLDDLNWNLFSVRLGDRVVNSDVFLLDNQLLNYFFNLDHLNDLLWNFNDFLYYSIYRNHNLNSFLDRYDDLFNDFDVPIFYRWHYDLLDDLMRHDYFDHFFYFLFDLNDLRHFFKDFNNLLNNFWNFNNLFFDSGNLD